MLVNVKAFYPTDKRLEATHIWMIYVYDIWCLNWWVLVHTERVTFFHLQMKYVAPVHISGDLVSLSHLVHYMIHVPRETDVLANCFSYHHHLNIAIFLKRNCWAKLSTRNELIFVSVRLQILICNFLLPESKAWPWNDDFMVVKWYCVPDLQW